MTIALLMSNILLVQHAGIGVAQWPPVPPEAVSWTLSELDSLADDMTGAILSEVPDYGRQDGSYARVVRLVTREVVRQFAARVADPVAPWDATARMFYDIGRAEAAQGRSLVALHNALRVGARVIWQWLREKGLREKARQGGVDANMVARLGESIFCYLDELAAACAAGYAEGEAAVATEAERLRRHLLDLLVSAPPGPLDEISGAARAAGWPLPRRVAVVALADWVSNLRGPLPPLPAGVIVGLSRPQPCLLVPDPDGPGRSRLLEAGLRIWSSPQGKHVLAAIGPVVPLARASGSLRCARRALALAHQGLAGGADRIIRCDEHLATLVMLADTELAAELSNQVLAPLEGLRPDQADSLARTLLAWLESADNAATAARHLHVHPQTVRYRLRRITELFGDRLADHDARFALQLALRVRQLSRATNGVDPPRGLILADEQP